ncbi:MAG: hypothetical protein COU07_01430 [Candidatus Harrisonbacteria bacterium CG10_big_fil_rev_8_21_14_0_10_40_38]|uniref:AAA+ ATPase domain-containing protein n=1 Tax=Candidatus Harrisonbacteria bacterium CG10_big_fil_rev_8_21_14_0_10_40_38 TaxID=1974583 RepID=A0A2H0UT00_9BACT|nr:MAG: hypothetical protein COU07_01430 [Candidatus Harrisonbacteria bacterium CG10_big_fil_rev_8_21_14_0_10_40_38]
MHLKRLELVGFKSFASKVILNFPGGVTGVVGPNGSGKSNIIDAIRWLLGEREAKSMRSLKAEDLIFAGTPERPRVGFAQATIVFDNTSRFFPVDFHEVEIRRRIDRDGSSKYFINDSEVRLKDVIDFFAQSRLGTKGFTIINQGDADLFVRSTPKERRFMLEEILGLRQYQLKKHDAELKLKSTLSNMDKVKSLVDEITPHLKLLRKQASKWEKQSEVVAELTDLEKQYFGVKLYDLEEEDKRIAPKINEIEEKIKKTGEKLSHAESELKKIEKIGEDKIKQQKHSQEIQQKKQKLSSKRIDLERELARIDAQIEIHSEKKDSPYDTHELIRVLEEVRETLEDILLESDSRVIKNLLKSLSEKIDVVFDSEVKGEKPQLDQSLLETKKKIFIELKELSDGYSILEKEEAEHNSALTDFTDVFREAFSAAQRVREEVSLLERSRDTLKFDRERLSIKREELAHQAVQMDRKLDDFSPVSLTGSVSLNEIERKILRLRGELASIGAIDPALIDEAKETEERYQFLSEQLADLEKACGDLKNLLKELDRKIHDGFTKALNEINEGVSKYFRMMFGGGKAKLSVTRPPVRSVSQNEEEVPENVVEAEEVLDLGGIDVEISIPSKRIHSLDMLSGGEKSLVSMAVLFALISVSPPPFLVLDEADAALDEANSRRFSELISEFSKYTQFVVVTHNRTTMEAADVLYGVTMGEDGASKVLSLKLG